MSSDIVNIDVDLPETLIRDLFKTQLEMQMSPPSYSIVKDALANEAEDMNAIYDAVGRATLNQILEDALMDKLERDKWMDKLADEEYEEDYSSDEPL